MKLVNLTGHPLRMGDSQVLLPADGLARITTRQEETGEVVYFESVEGSVGTEIPIVNIYHVGIQGLPAAEDGTLLICSSLVAEFMQREDVVAPGRVRRNEKGYVTAAHAFYHPGWRGGE